MALESIVRRVLYIKVSIQGARIKSLRRRNPCISTWRNRYKAVTVPLRNRYPFSLFLKLFKKKTIKDKTVLDNVAIVC